MSLVGVSGPRFSTLVAKVGGDFTTFVGGDRLMRGRESGG